MLQVRQNTFRLPCHLLAQGSSRFCEIDERATPKARSPTRSSELSYGIRRRHGNRQRQLAPAGSTVLCRPPVDVIPSTSSSQIGAVDQGFYTATNLLVTR